MYYLFVALAKPIPVCLLLSWLALWRLRVNYPDARRFTRWLFMLSVVIGASCVPATGYWLQRLLELRYEDQTISMKDVSVIVVLSSWKRESDLGTWHPDWDSAERCRLAAALYTGHRCKVIVCGGKVHESDPGPSYAKVLGDFMLTEGVKREDLILEEQSRTTYENVAEAARLLAKVRAGGKVMLVTSAAHLLRGEKCFSKQGVDVETAGCQFAELQWTYESFIPSGDGAKSTDRAIHEMLGIVWYWMKGRI